MPELQKKLETTDAWLYEEGKSSSKGKYQEQIDALKKIFDPIQKRFDEYQRIPKVIQDVNAQLQEYQLFVDSTVTIIFCLYFGFLKE